MMKPEFSKPFDLGHAKDGAPYGCRDGAPVEILKWNSSAGQPIIGVLGEDDVIQRWSANGQWGMASPSGTDLVMLPLGLIDGKPVFVGDEIEALMVPGREWMSITLKPGDRPRDSAFRWPAPAREYPQTTMRHEDLFDTYAFHLRSRGYTSVGADSNGLAAVVNAALRHAVDAGQAIPKDEHEAALHRLGERLKELALVDWAARDMAVAEAVRNAAYVGAMNCQSGHEGTVIRQLDLASIIFTVK